LVKIMQTIETTDPVEARRARYAQYRGQKATLTFMGSAVTGMVRSVNENGSGTLKRWIVTGVANQPLSSRTITDDRVGSRAPRRARWFGAKFVSFVDSDINKRGAA
jgi:hypothetical protein